MNKEEQQAFEASKKAIKRLLIEEKRMKAKLERIQKDKNEEGTIKIIAEQ